jgi:tetratricopeptide (TPR) repeat protein
LNLVAPHVQLSYAEESHPEIGLEADYSEAVFEFTNRRYSETVRLLNALLNKKPDHVQALELKALALKSLRNDVDSIEVYEKLLTVKPENERGPYQFELGTLYFRQKRFEDAKKILEKSIASQFNVGVSHFFLANAQFQTQEPKKALVNFKKALSDVPEDLQVACHYYLGMIHAQTGYGPGATNELLLATERATELENTSRSNAMVRDLKKAATLALEPYNRANWMKSASFALQYDGNVSSVSSIVSPEAAAGKISTKTNLGAVLGYAGSPLSWIQPVITYRLSLNKNFNSEARDYEFATNTLSLYLTHKPLSTTNFGTKIEGNYGFQNRTVISTGKTSYQPFLQSIEISPFLKHELIDKLQVTTELIYRPQTFPNDSIGIDRRSGTVILPRITGKWDTESNFLSPTASIGHEWNQALGTNQKSKTLAIDISNSMKLPLNRTVSMGITYTLARYLERVPDLRIDRSTTLRIGFQNPLSPQLVLTADASYTSNTSSLPEIYSYTKPTASVGLNYSF